MRSTFYCLKLPHTIYVDMFFKELPREAIYLKDEGMKSTGYCEDCCRHYWCLENDAHECDLRRLYCPLCVNELFCRREEE